MKTLNKEALKVLYVDKKMSLLDVAKELGTSNRVVRREIIRHNLAFRTTKELKTKHGMSNHRMYKIWQQMKNRCNNQKNIKYKYYGGKGISYDSNWKTFSGFYYDMKENYKDGLTLDRIDNSKGYYKDNCRWVTYEVQNNNKTTNRSEHSYSPKQIQEMSNVSLSTIYSRINKGWSLEKIINTPPLTKN